MTLVAFVVDSSASMNAKTANGTSLLDVAKNVVDAFIKVCALCLSQMDFLFFTHRLLTRL